MTHVARVFYALETSLEKLSAYYKSQQPTSDHPVSSHYFPSITVYRQGSRQDIVVKFVNCYGEKAH